MSVYCFKCQSNLDRQLAPASSSCSSVIEPEHLLNSCWISVETRVNDDGFDLIDNGNRNNVPPPSSWAPIERAIMNILDIIDNGMYAGAPLCAGCYRIIKDRCDGLIKEMQVEMKHFKNIISNKQIGLKILDERRSLVSFQDEIDLKEASLADEIKSLISIYTDLECSFLKQIDAKIKLERIVEQMLSELNSQALIAENECIPALSRIKFMQNIEIQPKNSSLFSFSYDGGHTFINGIQITWNSETNYTELNSALGEVAHLLDYLGEACSYKFRSARPICCGSFSKMRKYFSDPKGIYHNDFELYITTKTKSYDQINSALSAMISCMKELRHNVLERFRGNELPSKIRDMLKYDLSEEKCSVNGICLRWKFEEAAWNKGMKYLCLTLGALLALSAEIKRSRS